MQSIKILVLLIITTITNAQSKYEFRGVWVATIGGIDWPSPQTHNNFVQQQADLINLFDEFKASGINAIVFQIRPAADAFYQSSKEGWSKYLTGLEGQYPGYDPLKFAIEEAHKRNMELHAWFNPYRALVDARKNIHIQKHVTYTHPEWFINYGGKKYFDPGLPQVQQYLIDVVKEVVHNYNIDAVHMDDYFYPYKIGKQDFGDYNSYNNYGNAFAEKEDWRRDNVNKLIEKLAQEIKKEKPNVKFGISPFGVWRNYSKDQRGSYTTAGTSNYDDLYADVYLWLQKGWIDYVMPQLYWERGHKAADYTTLLNWWGENTFGKHLYIGHGLYQIGTNKNAKWQGSKEIEEQIIALRNNKKVQGSCYYSANCLIKNKFGIKQAIQQLNTNQTLVPPMPWLNIPKPKQPKVAFKNGQINIEEKQPNEKVIIYCVPNGIKLNMEDVTQIETILNVFTKNHAINKSISAYKYFVTIVNQAGIESAPVPVQ